MEALIKYVLRHTGECLSWNVVVQGQNDDLMYFEI